MTIIVVNKFSKNIALASRDKTKALQQVAVIRNYSEILGLNIAEPEEVKSTEEEIQKQLKLTNDKIIDYAKNK